MSFPLLSSGESVNANVVGQDGKLFVEYGSSKIEIATSLSIDPQFGSKEFDVYPLISPQVLENDVCQIFCGEHQKRVGWLIPVASLESDQHEFASNEHFLRYAYIAIRDGMRCLSDNIFRRVYDVALTDKLHLTELFHESTVFLVVSRETLVGGCEFDFSRAVPSLLAHGYAPLTCDPPELYFWQFNRRKKVKYLLSAKDPDEHGVVNALLSSFSLSKSDVVIQFFYLYQVIELLIERVARYQLFAIKEEIVAAGDDSMRLRAAIEAVGRELSEKERLNKLTGKFCSSEVEVAHLDDACRVLLQGLGRECKVGLSGALYPVRNLIFHNFRSFPSTSNAALGDVVSRLLEVLPMLLARFRAP